MSSPNWFELRGEQYMYDQGKWWRKVKVGEVRPSGYEMRWSSCGEWTWDAGSPVFIGDCVRQSDVDGMEYRIPCTQPFQVGDRVKVVRADGHEDAEERYIKDLVGRDGKALQVFDDDVFVEFADCGESFPPHCLEPAPTVEQHPGHDEPEQSLLVDPGEGWEIYEPIVGETYSEGTWYMSRPGLGKAKDWVKDIGGPVIYPCNDVLIYRRPRQKPVEQSVQQVVHDALNGHLVNTEPCKPLDIDLLSIERKINIAAVKKPEILDWWRGEKEKLAIEAGKRIGGGM